MKAIAITIFQANDGEIFTDRNECLKHEEELAEIENRKRTMSKKQLIDNSLKILDWCETLAKTQGFYYGLLMDLRRDKEQLTNLALQDFHNILDFVLFVEEC